MVKDLVIIGCGGFGAEAAWVAEEMNQASANAPLWNLLGYADDDPEKIGSENYGFRVLGNAEAIAHQHEGKEIWYFCAIGNNAVREKVTNRLDQLGWQAATLIHPSVVRAKNAVVGHGTYVGAMSVLAPNSVIGNHVIVNLHVSIGHDSNIEDYANICPGAQINGFCKVGRGSLVGSNASLVQGRQVGSNANLGANSLAINSVPENRTVIGVPAREMPKFGK
jgi:sugar O-acyltransferase (sialic acid O-acetyltransferase NeuD family)